MEAFSPCTSQAPVRVPIPAREAESDPPPIKICPGQCEIKIQP